MGVEIERKFLAAGDEWRHLSRGVSICQGYLNRDKNHTVRVRALGDRGFIAIKGPNKGVSRQEFEYEIPLDEAREILDGLCEKPLIEKVRYTVEYGGLTWEVDIFSGANRGLILVEVELAREDQAFDKPPWVGKEVTGDTRYFNSSLVDAPYTKWEKLV